MNLKVKKLDWIVDVLVKIQEKKLLENVKDMKPKEIIKYMKTFLGKDKIRDEYDINAYASYIYCKNNKLI